MKKSWIAIGLLFIIIISALGQGAGSNSMRKLNMVMYAIENLYVDKVDDDKLVEDAIVSILKELDPHSNYLNPDEVKEMNEPLQGNFDGIGIQFNMLTDTLYVISVISGGPSEKVGLLAGDRIIKVNDSIIAGVKMKNTDIMKRLKGKKGTTVSVDVMRKNVPGLITFNIIRDKIPIYSLDASYMIDKETGYIRLNRFAATSHEEFLEALKKLEDQGMKNLIFDLQGNGGGYLNAAISIANEFLGKDKLIVYTEGASQKREDAKANNKGIFESGRLVVLIDETSASASEIVAGAVQDWDRAVIVGRRSFGKGLVQRPIPLPDGSMIRLTTARYYTPTGRCIQKPYENGDEDSYSKDLAERYNRGEMLSADSIHFPDSMKYNTLINGRVVYGGGGIMPDYFVPVDTTKYSAFHRTIVAKGILNKLTMNYIDEHRAELKSTYSDFNSFNKNFRVGDDVMSGLFSLVREDRANPVPEEGEEDVENKIVPEETLNEYGLTAKEYEEFLGSRSLIELQVKALIARDLWEMNEYFQVMNISNDSYKKALEIIESKNYYSELLKGKK